MATNSGQALILADGPLAIEGLTFWRRSNRLAFSPLISVQAGSLHLLNCRVGRTPRQGEDPLVRDGLRVGAEEDFPADRPIIMVSPGSTVRLQNCVLVGQRGTGLGLLNTSREAIRVETDNSLFVIHRAFALRPRTGTPVELRAMRSVFVTAALLDVNDAEALGTTTVMWEDCFLDFKGGVLLRVSEHGDGTWMRAMTWRETNVVYAADGTFLSDQRGGQIVSETRWNGALRLATNSHQLTDHDVFVHARQRSSQSLRASDLDLIDTRDAAGGGHGFEAERVGEGETYESFRRTAEYRAWQRNTRIAMSAWKALRP